MWLFDNLFLDQNTPVTINDWIDHSKDFVAPKPPLPWATGWGANPPQDDSKKDDKNPPKTEEKKDGFTEMFAKPEEKLPTKTAEPEKDIALEIGLAPASSSWDSSWLPEATPTPSAEVSAPSFDIGGDLSFDIGGDIWLAPSPDTSSVSPVETSESVPSTGVTTLPGDVAGVPAVWSTESFVSIEGVPPSPGEINAVAAAIGGVSVPSTSTLSDPTVAIADVPEPSTPVDNALFSILNEDNPGETSPSSDVVQTNSEVSVSPYPETQSTDSLFSSLVTEDVTPITPGEQIVTEDASSVGWALIGEDNIVSTDVGLSHFVPQERDTQKSENNIIDTLYPNPENNNRPLIPTSASKLKDTLEKFISELESLEIEDEKWRSRRTEQIMIYRARIDEIRAESDARVRALEYEIQDLERQTGAMEAEKNRIKWVINSFKKELDASI